MVKRIIYGAVSAIYAGVSMFLLPHFLITAFNFGKGPVLNQDGIMFIPAGFVLVLITVILGILILRKTLASTDGKYRTVVVIITVAVTAIAILISLPSWESFFECLTHFRGLNLGKQI